MLAQLAQSKQCKRPKHQVALVEQFRDSLKSKTQIGQLCNPEPAGKTSSLLIQSTWKGKALRGVVISADVKARHDSHGGCVKPRSSQVIPGVSATGVSHTRSRGECFVVLPECAVGRTALYVWVGPLEGGLVRQAYSCPCYHITYGKILEPDLVQRTAGAITVTRISSCHRCSKCPRTTMQLDTF